MTPVPANSWIASAPYRFDFQGVIRGIAGAYVLTFVGTLTPRPPFTPRWTMAAAVGTLANRTTLTPTHTAPTTIASGRVRLEGVRGTTVGCQHDRFVTIYEDHLARDRDNFGTGISCRGPWFFTKYGVRIRMANTWNCFGSADHHYNGSGTGYVNGAAMIPNGWATTNYRAPFNWPAITATLRRGDVVSFWSANPAGGFIAQHAHTCLNSPTMYGANNEPGAIPSWRWFECTSEAYLVAGNAPPPPGTPGYPPMVLVKVHAKP